MKKENNKTYSIDEVGSMIEALTNMVKLVLEQNNVTNRHLSEIKSNLSGK